MSKLTDIATVEEAKEIAKNDFTPTKMYNQSVAANSGIVNNQVDNTARATELAKNQYSATNPYNQSCL